MRKIKDKEGVIFQIEIDPRVSPKSRQKSSVLYIKSMIENRLKSRNVFPANNKVGFHGDIEHLSYFFGQICEGYVNLLLIDNQIDVSE